MEYGLKYTDGRNYRSTVMNLIVTSKPAPGERFWLEIKTQTHNVLTIKLSKSEATAIVKSLSAALDANCTATISPEY